jgi:hypothetical protein
MCILASAGCGSKSPDPASITCYENLGAINGAYARATQKLGRPPANAEELVPHLKEVGDPATILKSPRDGEPYVIFWNVDPRKSPGIIARESRGSGGKKFVSNGRIISQMTDAEVEAAGLKGSSVTSPRRSP